jgi:hypothetical protein
VIVEAGPVLSAYRGEEETWRIDRLRTALKYIGDLPILSLRDHKGTLTVDWGREPTIREVIHVAKCWMCEHEWWTIHLVEGEMFFEDYPL